MPTRTRRVVSTTLFSGLVLLALLVALIVVLTSGTAQAARSAYTQAHGEREVATVISVQNKSSTSKGVTSWYGYILVRLPQPVGGQAQATVHVPDKVDDKPGEAVTVLVDPQSPSYAELPGEPLTTRAAVLVFSIIVIVFIIVFGAVFVISVRSWRRSRQPG
jgi:hypothetical protein